MSLQEIGAAIVRLGEARDAGHIAHAEAVTQLREVDPSLSVYGATLQLGAWKTAAARYVDPEPYTFPRPEVRAMGAITFTFPRKLQETP